MVTPSTFDTRISPSLEPKALLHILNSGQLLMLEPTKRNAIIICKAFHAEFVGPGAAVGGPLDIESAGIIPLGDIAFCQPQTYRERQTAFAKRMHWIKWLQQTTDSPLPTQRARVLLFSLEEFFSAKEVAFIPSDVLARLAGVLPQTIDAARSIPKQSLGNLEANLTSGTLQFFES